MSTGQSYPSPSASQVNAGAGPFYTQPPNVPSDLDLANELQQHNQHQDSQAQEDAKNAFLHEQLQAAAAESANQAASAAAASGAPLMNPNTPGGDKSQTKKASRACDECRGKKIRCDASPDTPGQPCRNCVKSNHQCDFSRQPMKRGPSKGYIKELADRVSDLESGFRGNSGYGQGDNYSPLAGSQIPRKRPKTSSDGEQGRVSVGPSLFDSPNGATDVQPLPAGLDSELGAVLVEWDDFVVDGYYRVIHLSLPILPDSKTGLRTFLANCPQSLREGFLATLDVTVRSFPSANLSAYGHDALQRAAEILNTTLYENDDIQSQPMNLVFLWSYILMALAASVRGPSPVGPSQSGWLGRAVGLARDMRVNVVYSREVFEKQPEALESLGRRAWWSLFVLDRFQATSTSTPTMMAENAASLMPEDEYLMGPIAYGLIRLSFVGGHIVDLTQILISTSPPASNHFTAASDPKSELLNRVLLGKLDRVRDPFEAYDPNEARTVILHAAYQYFRILMKRLSSSSDLKDLAASTTELSRLLQNVSGLCSPISQYLAALTAATFVELAESETTREEALVGLNELAEALGNFIRIAPRDAHFGWFATVSELIQRKLSFVQNEQEGSQPMIGLQHLADAAIKETRGEGAEENDPAAAALAAATAAAKGAAASMNPDLAGAQDGGEKYDPTALLKTGFMAAFDHLAA